MPKKKNGFGSFGVNGFKGVESKVYKGKKSGAVGSYPSNRQYGTTVHRSVIEQYDLDSDWTRWRKGYEYYNQAAYLEFATLNSVLYQGTEDEVPVSFVGERFATKNADSNTHYSIQRVILEDKDLGEITEVFNNRSLYPENYARNEIWAKVEASDGGKSSPQTLRRLVGERVTDGHTAANIMNVMTTDRYPAVYYGKTDPREPAQLKTTIPLSTLKGEDPQSLVNQVLVLQDIIIERPITVEDQFIDGSQFFSIKAFETAGTNVEILDSGGTTLPPDLLDLRTLEPLYKTSGFTELNAEFFFEKSNYQRFWGNQYLTADVVRQQVSTISYLVQPLKILSVLVIDDTIEIQAEPFVAACQVFAGTPVGYLIFNDKSFTTQEIDTAPGHKPLAPGQKPWERMNTDVDPWMDEVFTSGSNLTYADVYACSCPDYLHAILRMPEATSNGNRTNRQRRIPLPSALGQSSYDQLGNTLTAGTASSWASLEYITSHRMCKHTIASHFTDRIKVVEPKSYPTYEAREEFESKLEKDIKEVADEFLQQLRRSEITTIEIVASLAAALNLNDIELASVIINANF